MLIKFVDYDSIPQRLYNRLSEEIFNYSISILGLYEKGNKPVSQLIGSGTLVKYKQMKGILTAKHVVDSVLFKKSVGIGFVYKSRGHCPRVLKSDLIIERSKNKKCDIAFIHLPLNLIGWIEAGREFWNLELNSGRVLNNDYLNDGIWIISGAIAENVKEKQSEGRFKTNYIIENKIWLCEFEKEIQNEGCDKIDVLIEFLKVGYLPDSFGGTSGGSLWQIPIDLKGEVIFKVKDFLYTGIPFYQEFESAKKVRIKCEGRNSIYKNALELLS